MISLIVAFDEAQTMGLNNQMPWHYPEDLAYFKAITMGKPMVMGRKTFESILSYGGPLKGRHHYVLTRNESYVYDHSDVSMIPSWESLIEAYQQNESELMVVGGAALYEQLLPFAHRLYITHVPGIHKGDTYFPQVNWTDYQKTGERVVGTLLFCQYDKR